MTTAAPPGPRIFVCHSHRDNDFATQLVGDLRQALGGGDDAVWLDAAGGLTGGDGWWRKILLEIKERPVFVVILSPDAMESAWVNDEIDLAWQSRHSTAGKTIIPVLHRPCTVRADLKTLQMVSFLPPTTYGAALGDLLAALGPAPAARPRGGPATAKGERGPAGAAERTGPPPAPLPAEWPAEWPAPAPRADVPALDQERRALLSGRRETSVDVRKGIYPFAGLKLAREDVRWLLATHEDGRGPIDWDDEEQRQRPGLDLRGADLRGVNLCNLPLACVLAGIDDRAATLANSHGADGRGQDGRGGTLLTTKQKDQAAARLDGALLREAQLEGAHLRWAHMEEAVLPESRLSEAHLEGAHLRRAHLEGADLQDAHLEGADLSEAHLDGAHLEGAWLEGAILSGAWLQGAHLSKAHLERARLEGAHLEGADLQETHLEGALLSAAHLEGAFLREAHLEGARLSNAHLEGAILTLTHLERADLYQAHFEGKALGPAERGRIRKWVDAFPDVLPPADLRRAFFDIASNFEMATLADRAQGAVALADVHWNRMNLTLVRWPAAGALRDEREARSGRGRDGKAKDRATRLAEVEAAARADRQLAVALRDQGMNEEADRFAYRAQVLQRGVYRRHGRMGQYLFSWFLDGLAGYGYKPWRSLLAYVLVIGAFMVTYHLLGPTNGHPLLWREAFVISMTAFHGRGFFPDQFKPGDPQALAAAIEAFVGLVIEVSFIATFTQRFFGK